MKVYNAEGIILGRLASVVAKQALLGEDIRIVNSEKAIISGRRKVVFAREKQRRERKAYPLKSMTLSRLPHLFVRRAVRNMLPWKLARGKEAYRKIHCFKGLPAEFQDKQLIMLDDAKASKLSTLQYSTVQEICRALGGKQ